MKSFLSCYKFFNSFKIPILKEDKFDVSISLNERPLENNFSLKCINLNFFAISTNKELNNNGDFLIKISKISLFRRKEVQLKAQIINSYLSEDTKSHIIVFESEEESYAQYVRDYISSFSKKRLKKYLIKSSLEDLDYTNEEVAEIVTLLKLGFQSLLDKYQEKLGELLEESKRSIKSEHANLYLINTSNNTLEKKFSTQTEQLNSEEDFRKGIPGMVFSCGEIINIYNSRCMEFYKDHESADSYLALPLYNRFKDIIGVLEYKNKVDEKRFTKKDEDIASFMSILFSSYYQLYKPVHPASKIQSFNPGLKKEIHQLNETDGFKDSLYAVQKIKGQLESILINSSNKKALSLVVEEMIESSHAYDWKKIFIDCQLNSLPHEKAQDKSIVVLNNVESCSLKFQSQLLDWLDNKKVWLISTYSGKEINTELFSSDFQKSIARHHINFHSEDSGDELDQFILECVHSVDSLEGFDKKVQSFEDVVNQLHLSGPIKMDKSAS